MPESTPAPARPDAPTFDRRTLVRTAAWSVPAVSLASAAPAFAASTPAETCVPAAVVAVGWRVVSGQLNQNGSTGWQLGTTSANGTALEGAHLTGTATTGEARWFTAEPVGSFISFANNASTTAPVVLEVTYEFSVSGSATLNLANKLVLGYGSPNNNTERQTLEVLVVDGDTEVVTSRIGHQRLAGTTQRPTGSNESLLARREADLIAAGYTLHPGPDNGRTTAVIPGAPVVVSSASSAPRPVKVVYRITLDRRLNGSGVNDDLILNPPTVQSC